MIENRSKLRGIKSSFFVDNFKNKIRLIGFVPIGALAQVIATLILFVISSLFFDWTFQDIINAKVPLEKIGIIISLVNIPTTILGFKISHIIKPTKLTNKKFIITHIFFIALNFALNIGSYFWAKDLTLKLFNSLTVILNIGIFTLIIKDRKYNLFNMGK